ncbi:MAG TPA: ABC transporter substrate binding protein [Patescibacteria group bacterium]|nr:ABC transporter substrate binding protein [Patescibacteria group bacterium]
MRGIRFLLFLVLLGGVSFGGFVYARNYFKSGAPEINRTADTSKKEHFTIGLLGASPTMAEVFAAFKPRIQEREREGNYEVEFIGVMIPVSQNNTDHAVDLFEEKNIDLLITGQRQYEFLYQRQLDFPVIVAFANQPVQLGLARSETGEGNKAVFIEGGGTQTIDERLHFFLELMPTTKRILVLRGSDTPLPNTMAWLQNEALKNHIELVDRQFSTRQELNEFLLTYDFSGVDALFRDPGPFITDNIDLLFSFQARINKPIIVLTENELRQGGILSYHPSLKETGRRAGDIAYDLLSKELKPSNYPIQTPSRFELGINKAVAKKFRITVPPTLLRKADHIIE